MRALVLLAFCTAVVGVGCAGRTVLPGWIHKPRIVFCSGECGWVNSGGYGKVCVCPEDRAAPPCDTIPVEGTPMVQVLPSPLCKDLGDRPEKWDLCWYCKNNKEWAWLEFPEKEEE